MRKILLLLLLLFNVYSINSQEKYKKLPIAKRENPTYIYNKYIIGNDEALSNIENSKELINEVSVLKAKPDKKRDEFYNLTEYGIIFIDFKNNIDFKTQPELNEFFNLKTENDVYIDGYLINNKKFKIATKSIIELELIYPNTLNKLKEKVLNIWTLKKDFRYLKINDCSQSKIKK